MRINNNISLLNSINNLSKTVNLQSNSSYMLSSGNRLCNAKNDSAGLSISEKMRAQIRGLNQANRNSQDGISLVQTAEGALEEVHGILQRMRTLTIQSCNETYTDNDRKYIEDEVKELLYEINKISDTTEFNKQQLLGGSKKTSTITTISTYSLPYNISARIVPSVNYLNMYNKQRDASVQKVYTSIDELRNDNLVIENGPNKTIRLSGNVRLEGIKLDATTIECAEGTTLTISNVHISASDNPYSAVKFTGKNNELIVEGSNRLVGGYGASGINVNANTELTIKGTGSLRAEGNEGSAGIGGSNGESCGKISIESGTINVIGGYNGAGIGGGANGNGGEISISGGTVTVEGSKGNGAGIGGGANGNGGNVTISGGSVTSTGGANGAGIGGGSNGNGGNVIISGGTIDIQGGENAAGIGGGNGGSGGTTSIDQDNSTGSASGGLNAPGIGAGNGGTDQGKIDNDNGSMDYNSDKKYEWPYTAQVPPPSGGGGTGGSGGTGGNTGGGGSGGTGGGSSISNNQGIKLQIGADEGNILNINIATINTNTLGISNISVKTSKDAEASIDIIDKAIEKVSSERSRLGAYKNVLDTTINYLNYTEENMQASQSRIADVDYATEMLTYAKNNILIQAGQAMIEQNKNYTSSVLELLV